MQHLVSSLTVSGRPVHRLRENSKYNIKVCNEKQAKPTKTSKTNKNKQNKKKQAKQVYQYKNIKIKWYKSNAAIWYNKTCRIKQTTPTYVNIRVKGNKTRCQRTKNAAIRYRIKQELKFQYAKKQQLNEQLYKVHLECATFCQTTWQHIESTIDNNT